MRTRTMTMAGVAVAAMATIAMAATPRTARACGGCFAPSETVTVVTAHRMAVAISPAETTLWDQIEYAGAPEDFVWVLPIQGETLVELADNAFFEALDQATRVTLQGTFPPLQTFCPDPCFRGGAAGAGDAGAPGADAGVTVYGEAVVGPYETATIGSEDPNALVDWLRDNGYAVPDSILPVVRHYTDLGLNFAVLRLNPNAGVNQMQPVRITTPGLMPVFPLRMVAAGVEGSVGLELYVLGEGRYGSQNFAIGEIDPNDLAFDWSTSRFNYGEVFDATLAELGGRAWIAAYAQPSVRHADWIRSFEIYGEDGERHTAAADWEVVTRSIASPYLTKLRTDLPASALTEDLILEASLGEDVNNFISVSNERNRPADVPCSTTCADPWGGGGGGGGGGGTMRTRNTICTVQPGAAGAPWFAAAIGAAAALAFAARRRRK